MKTYHYSTQGAPDEGKPYHSSCKVASKALAIHEARLAYDEEYGLKRGIVFTFWLGDGAISFTHEVKKLSLLADQRKLVCQRCKKPAARRNLCWTHYRKQIEWEEKTPMERKAYRMGQRVVKKFDHIVFVGGRNMGKSEMFDGIEALVTTGT